MNNVGSRLTGMQALVVLERLASGYSDMARVIETEAKRVLAMIDVDEIPPCECR